MEFTDVISLGTVKYNVKVAAAFCVLNIFVAQPDTAVQALPTLSVGVACEPSSFDNVPADV